MLEMNGEGTNNKGFTAIELMLTISIFGLFILIVLNIFSSKVNSFSYLGCEVELQQQGLFIQSFLEEKIIESVGIAYIEDLHGIERNKTKETIKIKKIIFKNRDECEISGYVFNLIEDMQSDTYNLFYGNGIEKNKTGTSQVGNYIESIEVEPIPKEIAFEESTGVSLRIVFKYKTAKVVVRSILSFRNMTRR